MGAPANSLAYGIPAPALNNPRPSTEPVYDPVNGLNGQMLPGGVSFSNPTRAPGWGGDGSTFSTPNPHNWWYEPFQGDPHSSPPPGFGPAGGSPDQKGDPQDTKPGYTPPGRQPWVQPGGGPVRVGGGTGGDTGTAGTGGVKPVNDNPVMSTPMAPPPAKKPTMSTPMPKSAPEYSNIAKQPTVTASQSVAPVYGALPQAAPAPARPQQGPAGGPGRMSTPNMPGTPMKPTTQTAGGLNSGAGGYQRPQWQGQRGQTGSYAQRAGQADRDYNPYRRQGGR